jgi:hypothetical protein
MSALYERTITVKTEYCHTYCDRVMMLMDAFEQVLLTLAEDGVLSYKDEAYVAGEQVKLDFENERESSRYDKDESDLLPGPSEVQS